MNSRERMAAAMRHEQTDRVPVMCQLALGHYFLQTGIAAIDIWHDSTAFGDALLHLQQRYGFDGILINLPGREPNWHRHIQRVDEIEEGQRIIWRSGRISIVPPDDNPQIYLADGVTRPAADFAEIEPERLYYIEPHDIGGMTYPTAWSFGEAAARENFFPSWHYDTIRYVRARAPDVSVHSEVFSPFSQLMELLDYTNALMALLDDAGKVKACLEALTAGTIELMRGQAQAGADAVLISSAFAGGGFISREHYREFVLPCERAAIQGFRTEFPHVPVYTHTCGLIGDRLELMEETGTNGIDTLDPPPIGNVDLADAKQRIGDRLFIKGNIDPVNTVLRATPEQVREDAVQRIRIAGGGSGYVLSTACSVPPHAPPENVMQLRYAADLAREQMMYAS